MTRPRPSLFRALIRSLVLPGVLALVLGVLIVFQLVRDEYDELQDTTLISTANLLLRAATQDGAAADLSAILAFDQAHLQPDERSVFWILTPNGAVASQSPGADPALLPADAPHDLFTAQGHRFAVRASEDGGRTVVVAMPLTERNEALTDVVSAMILSFVLLGALFAGAAFLSIRRSVGTIEALSETIASKTAQNLTPIDRDTAFAEMEPAIVTLNTLMARLDAALAAERAFATNAAHELRTPVAISLAHVQRLKAQVQDPEIGARAVEIEQGLKRLVRLIERLLQLSRAQSGLGPSATTTDLAPVVAMLLRELRDRVPSDDRLTILGPTGPWPGRIDPDALGIILNNLFDNALKHGTADGPIVVDASAPGQVVVSNDCAPLAAADLEAIRGRYIRKAAMSEGYGLGLSIVQDLCDQSGCRLDIASPWPGRDRGFTATLTLP